MAIASSSRPLFQRKHRTARMQGMLVSMRRRQTNDASPEPHLGLAAPFKRAFARSAARLSTSKSGAAQHTGQHSACKGARGWDGVAYGIGSWNWANDLAICCTARSATRQQAPATRLLVRCGGTSARPCAGVLCDVSLFCRSTRSLIEPRGRLGQSAVAEAQQKFSPPSRSFSPSLLCHNSRGFIANLTILFRFT